MKKYLLILSILLFACEGDDADNIAFTQTPDLGGEWQLSGYGEQSGCSNKLDNVRYQIAIADAWQIVAIDTGNMDSSGFREYQLELSNTPDFVANFNGRAQGAAVSFDFDDTGAEDIVSYSFVGKAVANDKVKGTFSAQGPGTCMTLVDSSSFVVTIL